VPATRPAARPNFTKHRLARALSKLGVCRLAGHRTDSRGTREAERKLRRDPEDRYNLGKDRIEMEESTREERKNLFCLHKPRGVVTTASDEKGLQNSFTAIFPRNFVDCARRRLEWPAKFVAADE